MKWITATALVSSNAPAQHSLGLTSPLYQLISSSCISLTWFYPGDGPETPNSAVFLWWANSSWGFVRPHCTELLPTSVGVEHHAFHPSTFPETTSPSPSATGVVVLSLSKQSSQGIGSKHRSCFSAVLVLLSLEASPLCKVIPSNWDTIKCLGGSG